MMFITKISKCYLLKPIKWIKSGKSYFFTLSLFRNTNTQNTPCVIILSNYFKIDRFFTQKTILAIFEMSQGVADIYEHVQK